MQPLGKGWKGGSSSSPKHTYRTGSAPSKLSRNQNHLQTDHVALTLSMQEPQEEAAGDRSGSLPAAGDRDTNLPLTQSLLLAGDMDWGAVEGL